MSVVEFIHSPNANLDYGFNWLSCGWLESGETITTSVWTATIGIAISNEQNTGSVTSAFFSGGVVNSVYKLTNTITTSKNRTDSRQITLVCSARN
jgi:hypothetical protein